MMNCDTGTVRMNGCYWERVWHTITWFVTRYENEALQTVADLKRYYNPKVRDVWCEVDYE